jgi:hypothetical protein
MRRMLPACWITQATDIHSEYAILVAFPRQQWLCERALLLRCTYMASLAFQSNRIFQYFLTLLNYVASELQCL